jgi:hypothetical protein
MSEASELSELIDRAKSFARGDDFGSGAIKTNERIIALAPSDVDARNRLARCHLKAGRLSDAREVYLAVLELAPNDRIAQSGLREIDGVHSAPQGCQAPSGSGSIGIDDSRRSQSHSPRLQRALNGHATDPSDMVEALLHIEHRLRSRDGEWIRDMDETASRFRVFSGFTPRQSEVITAIYQRYFPRRGT